MQINLFVLVISWNENLNSVWGHISSQLQQNIIPETSNIYNCMTCMVYHFKPHIWRKETSCQIKSDNRFLQCGFHASIILACVAESPLQLLTNKSENAWLLHINMETHLFKEKRRETFHLINSKRWSYCFMILHWCITSASSKSTQEIHDINKISIVSPREQ